MPCQLSNDNSLHKSYFHVKKSVDYPCCASRSLHLHMIRSHNCPSCHINVCDMTCWMLDSCHILCINSQIALNCLHMLVFNLGKASLGTLRGTWKLLTKLAEKKLHHLEIVAPATCFLLQGWQVAQLHGLKAVVGFKHSDSVAPFFFSSFLFTKYELSHLSIFLPFFPLSIVSPFPQNYLLFL